MLYKENKKNQEKNKIPQRFEVFNSGASSKLNSILYNKKAFTLIELLVVIAIIGVLSTLVIVSLGDSRASARDAKRLNDLRAMANALELYYADNNEYPSSITPGQPLEQGGVFYMGKVPNNPTPHTDGGCPNTDYTYTQVNSGQSYNISTCLGTQASNSPSVGFTTVTYSPSGLFQCGQTINDLDGNVYNTVQTGTQCWMKENMNIGTMLASAATMPSNDNVIEKWCYNNTASNCGVTPAVNHGGLYTWAEAMNLPASCNTTDCSAQIQTPHQGICPDGFHIPTDQEFNTLEQYTVATIASTVTQYACNTSGTGWQRCADSENPPGTAAGNPGGVKGAGKSLKKVGQGSGIGAGDDLVGFSAMLSGYRDTGGTFSYLSSAAYLWLAPQSSSTAAWRRDLYTTYSTVSRDTDTKARGFTVRCLKDS
ncbi:MAG: FISUMP domain-containing protein [Patescibacteria group bacterium]|nr:MAG: FISUMP domain-containing protein [Patescibacteria group bacterium]